MRKTKINQTKIPEIRRIWRTTNSSALPKPLIKFWSKLSWQPLPDTQWLRTDSMEGKFCVTSLTACYSEMSRQGENRGCCLLWLKKSFPLGLLQYHWGQTGGPYIFWGNWKGKQKVAGSPGLKNSDLMIQSLTSSCYELHSLILGQRLVTTSTSTTWMMGYSSPFHLQTTLNWGSSGYAGGYYCPWKGLWQMKEWAKENLRKFNSGNSASGAE